MVEWLGELVRQVDSSLLDEWEQLTNPDDPLDAPVAVPARPHRSPGTSGRSPRWSATPPGAHPPSLPALAAARVPARRRRRGSAQRWPSVSPADAALITRSPPVRLTSSQRPTGARGTVRPTDPCTIPQVAAGALAVAGARMDAVLRAGATPHRVGRTPRRLAPAPGRWDESPTTMRNSRVAAAVAAGRRAADAGRASRRATARISPADRRSRGAGFGGGVRYFPAAPSVHTCTANSASSRASRSGRVSDLTSPPASRPPPSCTEDSKGIMELSRRDLLKVGLFSSAALMLPAERVARTKLAVANRLPQSKLPEPFTLPWKTPPARRRRRDRRTWTTSRSPSSRRRCRSCRTVRRRSGATTA